MNKNFLDTIKSSVEQRVASLSEFPMIKANALDFTDIFKAAKPPVIISEIKFSSPSKGKIYQGNLSPVEIAKNYLLAGSSALSVLTEPNYFKGNIKYIKDIRLAIPDAHILLKDFILSKKQIDEAHAYGANAILLIAAFLEGKLLQRLYVYAQSLGLTAIIEIHDLKELQKILPLSPKVVGINNRCLQTLVIDLQTSRKLINFIPDDLYVLCESGIESGCQIKEMIGLGFNGFLVGSSMMKHNNPGLKLQSLIKAVQDEG